MKKIIYSKQKFVVFDAGSELVIVNKNGSYRNHAHLSKCVNKNGKTDIGTAKTLIDLVLKHKIPSSDYLKVSAMRLSTCDSYKLKIEDALGQGESGGSE